MLEDSKNESMLQSLEKFRGMILTKRLNWPSSSFLWASNCPLSPGKLEVIDMRGKQIKQQNEIHTI